MGLSALKTVLTSKAGRQILLTKKHSPAILIGVGVVGMGATVVLACRATLRVDEVLREAEENRLKIETARALAAEGKADYSEEEAEKEGLTNKVQLAIKIAKLYAPAVFVGAITLTAVTGSYRILNTRNAGITAAYAALDKGFKEYRGRVVNKYGKEADDEFRFGKAERQIGVETDEGVAEKTVTSADPKVAEKSEGFTIYARQLDPRNDNWSSYKGRNETFLRTHQQWANDILTTRGFLVLNDLYKQMGLGPTTPGAVVGWVLNNPRGGDNYVDLGCFNEDGMTFRDGVVTPDGAVWIDPNVDGIIYDLLDEVV